MSGIFVSYRRNDSQGEAGRLFDDLVPLFGEHTVFMDVSAIEAGRDFRKAIEEGVTKCGVLLAVMGPEWLNAKDENGASRLNDPRDFVRLETASALKRDIPVIPVLVRGAKMPSAEQLPDDLKELAYRNCVELTHARWKSDIQLLVEALRRLLGDASQGGSSEPASVQPSTPRQEIASSSKAEIGSSPQFDPAVLQRVSRELALYIGQIADIVVRRAAPRCTSVEELYLKVAEEIDSPDEREKFLLNKAPIPPAPVPSVARPIAQANTASGAAEIPKVPEAKEQPPKPPSTSAGKQSQNGRKYWLLAGGGGALLILSLVLGAHFELSGGSGSHQTVHAPPEEAHAVVPTPAKADSLLPTPKAAVEALRVPPPATRAPESAPRSPERVRVSEEVSGRLLIEKILPVYPQLARQARIQGIVVLDADISRDGTVETLKAISGHPMLIPAAVEAAKQFRYKPYVLKGKPVSVNTQIVVKFTLSGG